YRWRSVPLTSSGGIPIGSRWRIRPGNGAKSKMQKDEIHVLLIEDNAADDELIVALLLRPKTMSFRMVRATRLAQALDRLAKDRVDLMLLDLSLPDSWGLDTFIRAHSSFPDVPII